MAINAEHDFEDRFHKHLPRSNDLTLIVLKGHLLLEEIINNLLKEILPNPNAISDFNFYFRLRLVRALLEQTNNDVLDAAEKLNNLRNKLAHHLEHPKIEKYIREFFRLVETSDIPIDEFEKEATSKRLKRGISFLCGNLNGLTVGYRVAKNVR